VRLPYLLNWRTKKNALLTHISLIFPHQLYKENPCLDKTRKVVLYEDPLYFSQYKFHQQKLVFHKATMAFYGDFLSKKKRVVSHFSEMDFASLKLLFDHFTKEKIDTIHYVDPTDFLLEKRIKRYAENSGIKLERYDTPNFFSSDAEITALLKEDKRYFMHNFYIKQRKRLNILVDDNGEPLGGKWSFDADNRKKVPKGLKLPSIDFPKENKWVKQAKEAVATSYKQHYGNTHEFIYPTTFAEAEKWLDDFLEERMELFGDYEDAMVEDESFLFHSLLTPMLNVGLLQPQQIIKRTLALHKKKNYPLNSLEGFIRQVIGWREFMRGIYEVEGVFERTNNYWKFDRKIPESFWEGTTGILPIDNTIQKLKDHAYCHHIERLMVFGNFFLLCEFDPDEVYRWFMEWFIDAYDWVMVPNVYGMTQYADGGLITTKPYISGSNYIRKMSNYKKGDWCDIWDGLYWRFIFKNKDVLSKNYRMGMMVNLVNKMDTAKLNNHIKNAEGFLEKMH